MKRIKQIAKIFIIVIISTIIAQGKLYSSNASEVSFGETYTDSNIYMRDTEYTIKDSGRFNQPVDRITTSDYTYPLTSMKKHYAYFSIIINISLRNVDGGNKYIFIYNGIESTSTLLESKSIEHT